jgi:hypothetical protein
VGGVVTAAGVAARLAVALVGALQLAYIAVVLPGISSGEALTRSIAQGMALIVGAPFLLLTVPAAILAVRNRRPAIALALAAASALLTFVMIAIA